MDNIAFLDFRSAAQEVLKFLKERIGFDLWMLTRVEGDDWIVLQAEDTGYEVGTPTVLSWADSFCVHMVEGEGPEVAPSSELVPAYASAAIGKQLEIGAYIGVPLSKNDGSLFGTLCAIHPHPQPDAITTELPLVRLYARLLSSLLYAEQENNRQVRMIERAETEALNDPVNGCYNPLTGLFNLNGWWQLLDAEEYRCEKYGTPARVFSVAIRQGGLDQSNSKLLKDEDILQKVSRALYKATHPEDIVAQVGENEFSILVVECDPDKATGVLNRLNRNFEEDGIQISIGYASRHPIQGLRRAWQASKDALERELGQN
jgi:GGDEF domain-containing protein